MKYSCPAPRWCSSTAPCCEEFLYVARWLFAAAGFAPLSLTLPLHSGPSTLHGFLYSNIRPQVFTRGRALQSKRQQSTTAKHNRTEALSGICFLLPLLRQISGPGPINYYQGVRPQTRRNSSPGTQLPKVGTADFDRLYPHKYCPNSCASCVGHALHMRATSVWGRCAKTFNC